MLKIGLCGHGKMGLELEKIISSLNNKYKLIGTLTSKSSNKDLNRICSESDIVIDFSHYIITPKLIEVAEIHNTKLLIGTTGLNDETLNLIKQATKKIPIFFTQNTSLGANILAYLVKEAAIKLKNDYDIAILDIHHRNKKDTPSGTALMLGNNLAEVTNNDLHFSSIRIGGIFGEHQVMFASQDEMLTLTHKAFNRTVFAKGAIQAADWLKDKPAGLYTMNDLLKIK